MKRKQKALLLVVSAVLTLGACGTSSQTGGAEQASSVENEAENSDGEALTDIAETSNAEEASKEEIFLENLPNWIGVEHYFYEYVTEDDGIHSSKFGMHIEFPSVEPTSANGYARQKDNIVVIVCGVGSEKIDKGYRFKTKDVDCLEDVFTTSTDAYSAWIGKSLNRYMLGNTFLVETEEPVMINGLSTYKYTGTHTYSVDGEEMSFPFVAYCIDMQQGKNAYATVLVMKDQYTARYEEPIAEGTLEAYARKMVESIELDAYDAE